MDSMRRFVVMIVALVPMVALAQYDNRVSVKPLPAGLVAQATADKTGLECLLIAREARLMAALGQEAADSAGFALGAMDEWPSAIWSQAFRDRLSVAYRNAARVATTGSEDQQDQAAELAMQTCLADVAAQQRQKAAMAAHLARQAVKSQADEEGKLE